MQIPENWKAVKFKEFFCFYLLMNKIFYAELFLYFVLNLLEAIIVELVAQISVSNKSYGCVDGIHVKEIVKNSYFECFPAILYLSFIRYRPVC